MKLLIHQKTGKKYLVKREEEFHTNEGIVTEFTPITTSSKGEKFFCIEPTLPDLKEFMKRGPQIIQDKDVGLIIAKTGINRDSVIVDAGGGTGALCFSLSKIAKKVTVYEVNPEHYKVLVYNKELFGANNVDLKQQSIYDGFKEEADVLTLDLPEPWQVNFSNVKIGGHVVVYLPNLTQVERFLKEVKGKLKIVEITETLLRNWVITQKQMRPDFNMLGHTAFLIFARRFK